MKIEKKYITTYKFKGEKYPLRLLEPDKSFKENICKIYQDQYGTNYYNCCSYCGEPYGLLKRTDICPWCAQDIVPYDDIEDFIDENTKRYTTIKGETLYGKCQKCNKTSPHLSKSPLCNKCLHNEDGDIEIKLYEIIPKMEAIKEVIISKEQIRLELKIMEMKRRKK